ncbi:ABC transporter ATP-binding protein [Granulosicoccus sp.]|nr:ABC transporter ATP-binding protein [Granulosicoccus sp.]
MLSVEQVSSGYGDVGVLKDISFTVRNEVFAVLGANGAGKTTLLKTLARLLPVTHGKIKLDLEDITSVPAYDLPARGIAYVPQENNVFPDMSVAENLSIGGMLDPASRETRLADIYELFPRLADRKEQLAGSLSGGEGQMLAVGRALMQDPQIILLDEPSAGLSPLFVDTLFQKISDIRAAKKVTIVLAEQNAVKALEIADRVLVLSLGSIHMIESASAMNTTKLKEAYHI